MRSLTSSIALVCAACALPSAAVGQLQAPRTLSFDSRYALTYSNDAMGHFGLEALDLAAAPAEAISLDGVGGDLMQTIVLLVGTDFVGRAFKLSFHEFGHGTRAAAVGFRPYFGYGAAGTPAEIEEARAAGYVHQSFFRYFAGSFFEGGGYTYVTPEDVLFTPPLDDELVASDWTLRFASGGLNNDQFFTELLADRVRRGGGHAGMVSSWVRGKISGARYGGGMRRGDVRDALDWYQSRDIDIQRGDLLKASTLSLVLSSTSYELALRTGAVLAGYPIRFEAWTPYGIELPNTAFYLTSDGLSYRVSAGYRRDQWRVPVAVEHVFSGNERTEYTIGGEWNAELFAVGGRITIGEGTGLSVYADRLVRDRFLVSGGYSLYDGRNLLGERMTSSREHGDRSHDLFLRLGVVY